MDVTEQALIERPEAVLRRLTELRTRGWGVALVTSFTWEPLYNQIRTITEPRETATGFTPPIGSVTPGRYTTKFTYDCEEGSATIADVSSFGLSLSGIMRGLGDLNADTRTDQVSGDLVLVKAPTVTLLAGSNEAVRRGTTAQSIETQLAWNDAGELLSRVDPEGNLDTLEYHPENDPDGDGTTVAGNSSTLPRGYLKKATRDAGTTPRRTTTYTPAVIATAFSYDPLGRISAVLNPRGVKSTFEWNALDELVSTTRASDVTVGFANGQLLLTNNDFAYKTQFIYDANGMRRELRVENSDTTNLALGSWVEQFFDYDILNQVVETRSEIDPSTNAATKYRHTCDGRIISVTRPAGNVVKVDYDERLLVFKVTRGHGSLTTTPSTVTYNYDHNGNLAEILDPEHSVAGVPARTTQTYDGFDRVVKVTDRIGGEQRFTLDPASNVVKREVHGHPVNTPGGSITRLSEQRFSHDELSRVFQTDVPLFLASGFSPIRTVNLVEGSLTPGDGLVTTRLEFDALSRSTFGIEDDGQKWERVYDGASRAVASIDPLGNRRDVTFDKGSNPTRVRSTERSPEGLVPNEIFDTLYVWDSLDRLARITDNAGQTARLTYDSRGNRILTEDAVGPLVADPLGLYTSGQINSTGNTVLFYFDGLNRLTKKETHLRVGGQGGNLLDGSNPAIPTGTITQTYVWDTNSRLTELKDDKNQATTYQFDDLDRVVRETFADATFRSTSYDRDDNPISSTDPNGTVVTRTFDNLNRLTNVSVALATGVLGTTAQQFFYDGASRLTRARDTAGALTSSVDLVYDSLGRLLEEDQTPEVGSSPYVVSSVWAGDGRRLGLTYASGTALAFTHDLLKRPKEIQDTTSPASGILPALAHWDWIGPGLRPLRRKLENGNMLSFLNDAGTADIGWDKAKRPVHMQYAAEAGGVLGVVTEELTYTYDRASNRTSVTRGTSGGGDVYAYDSAYRLVTCNMSLGFGAGVPLVPVNQKYTYDGVGNRTSKTQDEVDPVFGIGPTNTRSYSANSVNEYTSISGTSAGTYDSAGNMRTQAYAAHAILP
ncbi:MAG: hypothetical protein ACAI25_10770, partial [Planctomycetota bacterium]